MSNWGQLLEEKKRKPHYPAQDGSQTANLIMQEKQIDLDLQEMLHPAQNHSNQTISISTLTRSPVFEYDGSQFIELSDTLILIESNPHGDPVFAATVIKEFLLFKGTPLVETKCFFMPDGTILDFGDEYLVQSTHYDKIKSITIKNLSESKQAELIKIQNEISAILSRFAYDYFS